MSAIAEKQRSASMSEQETPSLDDRYFIYEQQTIKVEDFRSSGYVLDVGGGGEGIIGILKGNQAVAIDLRKSELEEAPDGALKIVADARDMPFLDQTFSTATAFFSLMYLKCRSDYEQVFREAYRVLKPGGRFLVWDANICCPAEIDTPAYVILLRVIVGDQEVETGYGQPWPDEAHDPVFHVNLAEGAGFRLVEKKEVGGLFFLELEKTQ